ARRIAAVNEAPTTGTVMRWKRKDAPQIMPSRSKRISAESGIGPRHGSRRPDGRQRMHFTANRVEVFAGRRGRRNLAGSAALPTRHHAVTRYSERTAESPH